MTALTGKQESDFVAARVIVFQKHILWSYSFEYYTFIGQFDVRHEDLTKKYNFQKIEKD